MNHYKTPVYSVQAIPVAKIEANKYTPNVGASPELALLERSIWEDGFTMPCVCYHDKRRDKYILVDGFHRFQTLCRSIRIFEREQGMLPVVVIEKSLEERISSTIGHNRARGTHLVELMSGIVSDLSKAGMSEDWIMRNIGMDKDELLRLKQISGLAELLADKEISIS